MTSLKLLTKKTFIAFTRLLDPSVRLRGREIARHFIISGELNVQHERAISPIKHIHTFYGLSRLKGRERKVNSTQTVNNEFIWES